MASTDSMIIWFTTISFSLSTLVILLFISRKRSSKLRPPGPPSWPLIGNLFDFGLMPHQNLHKLQPKYGPLLWLKLGFSNTLIVQSAKAAEELFKKHDLTFSDRKVHNSLTACDYNQGSVAFAPHNEHWRVIRKLCVSELLLQKSITNSAPARMNCIDVMIQWIKKDAELGEIRLDKYLCLMAFNLIGNLMLSREIEDSKSSGEGKEFYDTLNEFMEWVGRPNVVDVFPFLRWFDPQGIRRNTGKHLGQLLRIVGGFVTERIQEKIVLGKERMTKRDFLDSLLEYRGDGKGTPDQISEKNVTIIVLEMFFGGIETTSSTINWAMSELLNNPESMQKLQNELDHIIGRSRNVEEADLNSLPYLNAVVKETLRLHPSFPFLIPRKSRQDTEFMGYFVPMNTTVILNAWAIHRDPDSWDDPLSFNPNRFLNSNVDFKGQNFELIPFGSGRRSCAGMSLADKTVSLTLARLVQCFEWKLPDNVKQEGMDMREMMGIALRKLVPLTVVAIERES